MSVEKHCEIIEPQNFSHFVAGGVTMAFRRPGLYAYISFSETVDDDLLTKGQMKITPDGLITFESEKSIEAFVHLSSRELVQQNKNQLMGLCSRYGANYLGFEAIPRCPGRVFLKYQIASNFPGTQLFPPSENTEGAREDGCPDEASLPALADAPANIIVTQEVQALSENSTAVPSTSQSKTKKKYRIITAKDREILEARLKQKLPESKIMEELGICEKSLNNELRNNCSPGKAYCAVAAQKKSHERMRAGYKKSAATKLCPMRKTNPPLFREICRRLQDGQSKAAIVRDLVVEHQELTVTKVWHVKKYWRANQHTDTDIS